MGKKEYASSTTPNQLCRLRCIMCLPLTKTSVHPPDHSVDLIFPVASVSTLHKVCGLLVHSTTRWWQLERPEEVVGGLEVLANCVNLMDEVLNTDDAIFACRSNSNLHKFSCITIAGNQQTRGELSNITTYWENESETAYWIIFTAPIVNFLNSLLLYPNKFRLSQLKLLPLRSIRLT